MSYAASQKATIACLAMVGVLPLPCGIAQAQVPDNSGASTASASDQPAASLAQATEEPVDPTGGAYTTPTLLFIPAGAVPKWNVRVIGSTEVQSPSGLNAGIRPGLGAEVGLPGGVTLSAGTNWVGGDVNPNTGTTEFNLGLSPYFQARYYLVGSTDGTGFQLGTSVTYKFVGFEGDPGEMEFALSSQYRARRFEAGLQGVIGKDLATTDADGEVHAYALYRVVPQLGLGAAGQLRLAIVSQLGETTYDTIGGSIASLTIDRYQVAALAGASTIGLAQGRAGAFGQLFATTRF
jgi:hypothetical protein